MRRHLISSLAAGASLLAAWAAAAQSPPAPGPYMDARQLREQAAGVPPEGAPIAKGTPRGPGSLTGVWYNAESYGGNPLRTKDGEVPPMLPWVKAAMDKRAADAKAGHPYADPSSRCLPRSPPALETSTRTLGTRFIEEPKAVTILVEEMTNFRQIFLNAKHNPDAIPSYMGDSIGHWEGDALVVEVTSFNPDADVMGMPHSDAMRVIQRFRRITPDRLEVISTIDDPKAYSAPWTLPRRTMKLAPPGQNIVEYLCTNQRNGTDANGKTVLALPPGAK